MRHGWREVRGKVGPKFSHGVRQRRAEHSSTSTEWLSEGLRVCAGLNSVLDHGSMGLRGSPRLGWAGTIKPKNAHVAVTFRLSRLSCKIAQPVQN